MPSSPRGIARALIAKQTAAQQQQLASSTAGPMSGLPAVGAQQQSPMQQSWGQFNYGIGIGPALPRPREVFNSGAFGPLTPLSPMTIDETPPGRDRPPMRRWQYPVGWNLPVGQPGSEGLKLACYSDDTDILTRRGWSRFADLRDNDDVATRNPITHAFEWQRPTARHAFEYNGEMVHFTSRGIDLLVTPNHRVLHTSGGGANPSELVKRADEAMLLRKGKMIGASIWSVSDLVAWHAPARVRTRDWSGRNGAATVAVMEPGITHPLDEIAGDDFAAFMGTYLSEGCVSSQRIYISQAAQSKGYEEYRALLVRLFGEEPPRSGISWNFTHDGLATYLSSLGTRAWEKRIPDEVLNLSERQLRIFWHFYWLGDGHRTGAAGQVIVTTSAVMAGQLQEVAQKMGLSATVRSKPHSRGVIEGRAINSTHDCYNVFLHTTTRHRWTAAVREAYVGTVRCVSVPNGVVYVRRNGTPIWSGNSFQSLRSLADLYSIARAAIQVRKEELLGLEWEIVPTSAAAKAMKGDKALMSDFADRQKKVLAFWKQPDRNYHTMYSWLGALLDELFVIDAVSLHLTPPRVDGKGVLNSNLAALDLIDGSTIRPLVDILGAKPLPPYPAHQQYLWGVPRSDTMTILTEEDIEEIGDPSVAEYSSDQLLYIPYTRRTWTPYGFPPMERALLPIITGLRRQQYWYEFYSEGSVPGVYVVGGDSINTPTQARQLQDALNAIAGDTAYKHKIIVLPKGSSTQEMRQTGLADAFDATLAEQVLMAFDVQPMEVGLMPGHQGGGGGGLVGKGLGQASSEIQKRKATKPLLRWLKMSIFDYIIQSVFRQEDMEFKWMGLEEEQDEAKLVELLGNEVDHGSMSIDEMRQERGRDPWGLPMTSTPHVKITAAPFLLNLEQDPADQIPTPPPPFGGAGGPPAPGKSPIPPKAGPNGTAKPGTAPKPGTPPKPATATKPGTPPKAPAKKPPSASQTSTPLHDTTSAADDGDATKKAIEAIDEHEVDALREIDALRAYLRKRENSTVAAEKFVPKALSLSTYAKFVEELPEYGAAIAFTKAKLRTKQEAKNARRDTLLLPIVADVASKLGGLARRLNRGQIPPPTFVTSATTVLGDGYRSAYDVGAHEAYSDYEIGDSDRSNVAGRLAMIAPFLAGLAKDVASTTDMGSIGPRLDLYGQSAQPVYEQGYSAGIIDFASRNAQKAEITWHLGDTAKPCDKCIERDGSVFGQEDLPGFPGDGDFGSDLCLGGPQCFPSDVEVQAADIEKGFTRWYEGDLVEIGTRNGKHLSATPNHPVLTCNGWVSIGKLHKGSHVVDGSFRQGSSSPDVHDMPTSIEQVVSALGQNGIKVRQGLVPLSFHGDGSGSSEVDIVDTNSSLSSGEYASRGERFRKHNLVGRDITSVALSALRHALSDSDATSAAENGSVRGSGTFDPLLDRESRHLSTRGLTSFRESYDSGSSSHSGTALWSHGDKTQSIALADSAYRDSLFAKHFLNEPDAASVFERETLSGITVDVARDEIISVERRTFAGYVYNLQTATGWYVANGIITHNCGCWLEYNLVDAEGEGEAPAEQEDIAAAAKPALGKGTADDFHRALKADLALVAAGLAVRAEDTGRVLMLQRALEEDDPAAGKWEFPGGKLEDGEDPLEAAKREWEEETGVKLPDGKLVSNWDAANGVYRGFVYSIPSEKDITLHEGRDEVTNPDDPDHDQIEDLAWWDSSHLPGLSSLRTELRGDLSRVLTALGSKS